MSGAHPKAPKGASNVLFLLWDEVDSGAQVQYGDLIEAQNTQVWHPRWVARMLDKSNIYVWDGNYYALAVTERLGLEESGSMVRVGPVHYNTVQEIHRFGETLGKIATG